MRLRGTIPILIYDGADPQKGLRCVACQICEKECPPKCIFIEKSADKKPDATGKAQFYPAVFNIDISVCMSCQICVEVCPFEAIKMDTEFELSTDDRFGGLLFTKEQLAKPNEHYHTHSSDGGRRRGCATGGRTGQGRRESEGRDRRQGCGAGQEFRGAGDGLRRAGFEMKLARGKTRGTMAASAGAAIPGQETSRG